MTLLTYIKNGNQRFLRFCRPPHGNPSSSFFFWGGAVYLYAGAVIKKEKAKIKYNRLSIKYCKYSTAGAVVNKMKKIEPNNISTA